MDFKNEITRIKRILYFLNRTSTTIINNMVTQLSALTDVTIYEPSTGEVLIYNEVTGKWENGPQSGGGASISDTAYGVSWDGDTTNGASKNALYDKFESLSQNIDGGVSDSVYLVTQLADGGPA